MITNTVFVALYVTLLFAVTLSSAQKKPYCVPTQSCWPSVATINKFKSDLDGWVLQKGDANYTNVTYMKYLSFTRKPGLIVLVLSGEDVRRSLVFARNHNIELAVQSSGHSFNGRSTVEGGLMINFLLYNNVTVDLADLMSTTGSSVTAQAGASWINVYKEVDKFKKQVVGGSAHTVSVSGYTMGGGHSPLTRSLGLAVDNVVKFVMVLHNGTIGTFSSGETLLDDGEKVTMSTETELFWAVRGGGGGTYGVVLSFTFRLHKPPSGLVRYTSLYPLDMYGDRSVGEELVTLLARLMPTLPKEWGGYVIESSVDDPTGVATSILLIVLVQNAPWESASTKAIDELVHFKPGYQQHSTFTNYSTFLEYELTAYDPIYIWSLHANAFFRFADFTSSHIDFFSRIGVTPRIKETSAVCVWVFIRGNGQYAGALDDSSVSSDFRSADIAMTCGIGYMGHHQYEEVTKDIAYLDALMAVLGHGAYFNEAAYVAKNWTGRFWGENYGRLVDIKKKNDPNNMFWCHHCVGSGVMATRAAVLGVLLASYFVVMM